MDVVTAFLNPDVEEEIFIQFPQGLEVPEEFKKGAPALRLLKGLMVSSKLRDSGTMQSMQHCIVSTFSL
jgi:hypothetical protein